MTPMKSLLVCTLALCGGLAGAAPAAAPVRAEIDALLVRLEASGCRFNRNGAWYGGREARQHLLQKLDYIERRGSVASTEQFIELAASRSSASGKPYRVQCRDGAPVDSAVWLNRELGTLRAAPGRDDKR